MEMGKSTWAMSNDSQAIGGTNISLFALQFFLNKSEIYPHVYDSKVHIP